MDQFKIGDLILYVNKDMPNYFALHLITKDLGEHYGSIGLACSTCDDWSGHGYEFRWPKTPLQNITTVLAFDGSILKSNANHKCRCPKEIWLYQGCKCGGA